MAAYADFDFYTKEYGGTAVTAEKFKPLAIKASALVDRITFNRAESYSNREEISLAVCAAVDSLFVPGNSGRELSENNDGYSVTYQSRTDAETEHSAVCAARLFLPNELTNRGCFVNDYE